ncbi:RNA polymerase sigma factor [Nocardia nova SH22a]|uniref:RNA polymerase sigma factor n=1 Tax=Nocardia nova SH22a TaxID=1415166 RepID=W5THN6_9NOCA|nr:SigB/SigF/SigG family RNA polymerase sigma factor [Nocardia nova]AHH18679.1 RNA polymerase sigma factor [Nocardia nova SH22a]
MTQEPMIDARPRARHGPNSYDNIEPWFDKLAGYAPEDPERDAVRSEIVRLCLPLADHIARRFTGRGENYDDLHQVARLGLVLAVDRYDVGRGTSFLSFAVPTMMGEVRRHFRDVTWATRVPRRLKELRTLLGPATDRLAQRLGHMPTAAELSSELDIDVIEVGQAIAAGNAYRSDSLDEMITADENEIYPVDARLGAEEPCYELTENAMAVRPLIEKLPPEERRILIMRFFESRTQTQIARTMNISQMQVSRILARTLHRLHDEALCEEPEPVGAART